MHGSFRYFRDLVIEEICLHAKLLISDYEMDELLNINEKKNSPFCNVKDQNAYTIFRPEDIEWLTLTIRKRIGNMPDAEDSTTKLIQLTHELGDKAGPFISELSKIVFTKKSGQNINIGEIDGLAKKCGLPSETVLTSLNKFLEASNRKLGVFFKDMCSSDWDGIVSFSTLFNKEAKPKANNLFLDQQYIDFLSANKERLDKIHWRNFERLTAQYFNNMGYNVDLGPGTNDGGVDVRIYPKQVTDGPPLIIIQCKRYSKTNQVSIDCVKAFWTDLIDDMAGLGLIATTSSVALGGKKICEARKWSNLEFAENKDVLNWIDEIKSKRLK